ncbi:protein RETICULATA-RELATED 4, chloroplastic-like [Salvia miltiorrhiza]|uniref:protein RETICULATA-RELATED 4, chloroplastic-like n=1 Tax=Salvia miltiorrhiza TaxID=226208 RepID=UPI0025AB80A8|nr:protein RETICULATA-RELATED 4, chloroplastic-like [Salvia miltiorrhiza]
MATAAFSRLTTQFIASPNAHHHHRHHSPSSLAYPSTTQFLKVTLSSTSSLQLIGSLHSPRRPSFNLILFSVGGGDESGGGLSGGGGGGGGGGDSGDGDAGKRNKAEAIMALAEAGRSLDSIPKDLAAAIEAGRIPGSIVHRFFELEKSPFLGWLLRFGGFKERLLADDLFLTKVGIECGVGIFTKVCHLFHIMLHLTRMFFNISE